MHRSRRSCRHCRDCGATALMTRHNIPLGRILGIPIGLDYSWFVIFALLTWVLADSYFPAEFKNLPSLLYWFMGAVTAVMLFVSLLLHELGHSVVALRYKIPVRSIPRSRRKAATDGAASPPLCPTRGSRAGAPSFICSDIEPDTSMRQNMTAWARGLGVVSKRR